MPDQQEIHKVPKQWICNVANSILKNIFQDWVKQQVDIWNRTVTEKKDMIIQMDPEIAAAFFTSTKVSRKWYKTHFIDKVFHYSSTWSWSQLVEVGK